MDKLIYVHINIFLYCFILCCMANLSPLWLTVITSFLAFFITSLGGAVVFFFKNINKTLMQLILSFSAGIMIASSFFSLILEAIEQSTTYGQNPGIIATLGIFAGIIFIIIMEIAIEKWLNKKQKKLDDESTKKRKPIMSTFAISLHNIPEGLCIGVAFAGARMAGTHEAIIGAILLAVGIGLQNFPEGTSVSLPLYNAGFSKSKSFIFAMLSGIVEPFFAVVGYFFTDIIASLLPFCLTFAAGTMIAVSCIELLPESLSGNKNVATFGLGLGFCVMMLMDLLL